MSVQSQSSSVRPSPQRHDARAYQRWILATVVVIGVFAVLLYRWVRFALHDEAQSHILLVPLVSAYFVWIRRRNAPAAGTAPVASILPFLLGAGLVAWYLALPQRPSLTSPDALAFTTAAFVCTFVGVTFLLLGTSMVRFFAFPLGFLIFMIPMPTWLTSSIEGFLQQGSASAAHAMFSAAGTPLVRYDLVFRLPGIVIQIAPECSGIRSTLALFITAVVAGYLFLRSPWNRTILAVAVIPLALLRNGFRVFTIGELCVHISPDMIDSFIHHQGGPIFFALSLIPFALLLRLLVKLEARRRNVASSVVAVTP